VPYFAYMKTQVSMQYDIFYDPLVDAEGLEETSEDDLWFLPGPMEEEPDWHCQLATAPWRD